VLPDLRRHREGDVVKRRRVEEQRYLYPENVHTSHATWRYPLVAGAMMAHRGLFGEEGAKNSSHRNCVMSFENAPSSPHPI
jgi:hypothetical protein